MRRTNVTCTIAAVLVLQTGTTWAQSPAERERARQLMDLGDDKIAQGDAAAAFAAYQSAHATMHVPSTGAAVARAGMVTNQFLEARAACLEVARMPEARPEPAAFREGRAYCAEVLPKAEAALGGVLLRLKGQIPDDLQVAVDDAPVPRAALHLAKRVNPGRHVISLTGEGIAPIRMEVAVVVGRTEEVVVVLTRTTESQATPSAVAQTLPPPTSNTPVSAEPTDGPGKRPWSTMAYVGVGTAGAGVLVGSVAGMVALSKSREAKAGCDGRQCPPENQTAAESSHALGNVSTVAFGVALIGASVGIYEIVFASPPQASQAWVRPVVAPGLLGLHGRY